MRPIKGVIAAFCFIFSSFLFAESSWRENIEKMDFLTLLGKNTERWQLLKKEETPFLVKCQALYEKNYAKQFEEGNALKIPKIIHFIWIGPKNFPVKSLYNLRTWVVNHPDYKILFWTDRPRFLPIQGIEMREIGNFPFLFLENAYKECTNFGAKSDMLRYEILYQMGGIYADHDADSIIPFDPLNKAYDFYCCLEPPHAEISTSLTVGVGVLGSKPQHTLLLACLKNIEKKWLEFKEKQNMYDNLQKQVLNVTYIALTQELKEKDFSNFTDINIVLPAAYFFACKGIPSLYSHHYYDGAWYEKNAGSSMEMKLFFQKMHFELQRVFALGGLSILLAGMFIIILVRKRKNLGCEKCNE